MQIVLGTPVRALAAAVAAVLVASAAPTAAPAQDPWPRLSIGGDAGVSAPVGPGVVHHRFSVSPWGRVDVLDVEGARCRLAGVKAGGRATGRAPVRASLVEYARNHAGVRVAGGVNGDMFHAHGVTTGIYVHEGRVIAGNDGPLKSWHELTVDSAGTPRIERIASTGTVAANGRTVRLTGHNHAPDSGLVLIDTLRGDTVVLGRGSVVATLRRSGGDWRVSAVHTLAASSAVHVGAALLVAGPGANGALKGFVGALSAGDRVTATSQIVPGRVEAIGGFPVLVRGGVAVPGDSLAMRRTGPARVPRTAVALLDGGRRILLVTVAADQNGGIPFADFAVLLQGMGAREALNLDGGPSPWMEVASGGGFRAPHGGSPPRVSVAVAAVCTPGSSR